jgi:hypothetical protein
VRRTEKPAAERKQNGRQYQRNEPEPRCQCPDEMGEESHRTIELFHVGGSAGRTDGRPALRGARADPNPRTHFLSATGGGRSVSGCWCRFFGRLIARGRLALGRLRGTREKFGDLAVAHLVEVGVVEADRAEPGRHVDTNDLVGFRA